MEDSKRAPSEKSRTQPRDRTYVETQDLQSAPERYGRPVLDSVCASTPEVGAQCGSSARWDLRGGPSVRTVPTATCAGANR